eukprot:4791281-Amphidinium_carterae.2
MTGPGDHGPDSRHLTLAFVELIDRSIPPALIAGMTSLATCPANDGPAISLSFVVVALVAVAVAADVVVVVVLLLLCPP